MQPSSTLSFRLHALVYSMDSLAGRVLKQHTDISFPQFLIVLCAHQNPGHSQRFAAEWLQITEATVSYLVKRVADNNYIEARKDAADSRAKRIYATHKGCRLIEELYPLLEQALAPHVNQLNNHELLGMTKAIDKLYASIQQSNEENC